MLNVYIFIVHKRKYFRNLISVEITQPFPCAKGVRPYLGSLSLKVNEVSGLYYHEIVINGNNVKFDVPCHDFDKTGHMIIPVSDGVIRKIDLKEAQ